jgi:CO/xanthine dehydrogenase FAD-binding subunit
MKNFDYFAPQSLVEALDLLNKFGGQAKVLAGGTDLVVRLKNSRVSPAVLIDVKKIPELHRLEWQPGQKLYIGSAVPLSRVLDFPPLQSHFHLLFEACSMIGSLQLRNRATIGGNLCNGAPSADSAPTLLCLDARVHISHIGGDHMLPVDSFFRGPGQTLLGVNELVAGIEIPAGPERSYGCYLRHTPRKDMDIAVVGVAVSVVFEADYRQFKEVRIALGAVAPIPLRVPESEAMLTAIPITAAVIQEAAENTAGMSQPISDLRGSADYRREIVKILCRRALQKCWEAGSKNKQ